MVLGTCSSRSSSASSFTDAQDIARASGLLEEDGAGLLELQNDLRDQTYVQLLGLFGSHGHPLDQNFKTDKRSPDRVETPEKT